MQKEHRAAKEGRTQAARPHIWEHRGAFLQCGRCWTCAATEASKAEADSQGRAWAHAKLGRLMAEHSRGRLLLRLRCCSAGGGGGATAALFCLRCGGFGVVRARKLVRQCSGKLTQAGRGALRRVLNGRDARPGRSESRIDVDGRGCVRLAFNGR